jgi:hypothetical protein
MWKKWQLKDRQVSSLEKLTSEEQIASERHAESKVQEQNEEQMILASNPFQTYDLDFSRN